MFLDFVLTKILRNIIIVYAIVGAYAFAAAMGLVPAAPVSPIGSLSTP